MTQAPSPLLSPELRQAFGEARAALNRRSRPSGLLALLIRLLRCLRKKLADIENAEERTLPFLISNLCRLIRPIELLQYATTFCGFCAASLHIGRRVPLIERRKSGLFLLPVQFLLGTIPIIAFLLWAVGNRLPAVIYEHLPVDDLQRVLTLGAFVFVSPIFVALLAFIVRLAIRCAGFIIPDKHLKDPHAIWSIILLFNFQTWKMMRVPNVIGYLLYAGPYVAIMSSILACLILLILPERTAFFEANPGNLGPKGAVFFFYLVWFGFWGVVAQRTVIDPFTTGLPMVMSGATVAMTLMVIPDLCRKLMDLTKLTRAIVKSTSPQETVNIAQSAGLGVLLIEIEFDIFVYRLFKFPFTTNFLELYQLSRVLEVLADVYVDDSEPHRLIVHLGDVLRGTAATLFDGCAPI